MSELQQLLLMAAIIFAINLMPAFAPPTWMVLVFFNVRYDLPIPLLVVVGAVCAATGRLALGTIARHSRRRFNKQRIRDLDSLRSFAESRRATSFGALMLFAISPLPSASLFIAAGLTGLKLLPLTLAFFSGRIVSYSIYVSASSAAADSIEKLLEEGVTSMWSLTLQLLLLAIVLGLAFAPWSRLLARWLPEGAANGSPEADAGAGADGPEAAAGRSGPSAR